MSTPWCCGHLNLWLLKICIYQNFSFYLFSPSISICSFLSSLPPLFLPLFLPPSCLSSLLPFVSLFLCMQTCVCHLNSSNPKTGFRPINTFTFESAKPNLGKIKHTETLQHSFPYTSRRFHPFCFILKYNFYYSGSDKGVFISSPTWTKSIAMMTFCYSSQTDTQNRDTESLEWPMSLRILDNFHRERWAVLYLRDTFFPLSGLVRQRTLKYDSNMVTYLGFLERDSETELVCGVFTEECLCYFMFNRKKKPYYISLPFIICISWFLSISITSAIQTTYKLSLTSSLFLVKIFQKLKIINQFGIYIPLCAWNVPKYW